MKRLEEEGDLITRQELLKDYQYDGIDTCAVDGMCAANCPVDINTGDLVKRLRRENHSAFQNKVAAHVSRHFSFYEAMAKFTIRTGFFLNRVFGKNFMKKLTIVSKKIMPAIPLWPTQIKKPGRKIENLPASAPGQSVVYFSSCISRVMGDDIGQRFLSVCKKADIGVIVPAAINGSCCGQVFSSKGYQEAYRLMANQTIERLWQSSSGGKISIVMDVTSCSQTIKSCSTYLTYENKIRFDKLVIMDVIDFVAEKLLPVLKINNPKESIVFHPVCSVYKMGSLSNLQLIGKTCARVSTMPVFAKCCGMAGDRGFYYPSLTNAATKIEADEVKQNQYDGYYSSSVTCEMALSEAVGKKYESILKLLDEVSE